MTRNHLDIGFTKDDERKIYYDFSEKAFYKKRLKNREFSETFYFIAVFIIGIIFRELISQWYIEPGSDTSFFIAGIGILLSTFTGLGLYKKEASTLLNNKTYQLYIRDDELDDFIVSTQHGQRRMIRFLIWIIITFLICGIIYYNTASLLSLFLCVGMWFGGVTGILVISPYKRYLFYKKYKSGELLKELEEQNDYD